MDRAFPWLAYLTVPIQIPSLSASFSTPYLDIRTFFAKYVLLPKQRQLAAAGTTHIWAKLWEYFLELKLQYCCDRRCRPVILLS